MGTKRQASSSFGEPISNLATFPSIMLDFHAPIFIQPVKDSYDQGFVQVN